MKHIRILRDVTVRVGPRAEVSYRAGRTYDRVPEAQAAEILRRGAGELLTAAPKGRRRGFAPTAVPGDEGGGSGE